MNISIATDSSGIIVSSYGNRVVQWPVDKLERVIAELRQERGNTQLSDITTQLWAWYGREITQQLQCCEPEKLKELIKVTLTVHKGILLALAALTQIAEKQSTDQLMKK